MGKTKNYDDKEKEYWILKFQQLIWNKEFALGPWYILQLTNQSLKGNILSFITF